MNEKEIKKIKEDAKKFVKENKKEIVEKFTSIENYPSSDNPMSFLWQVRLEQVRQKHRKYLFLY